MTAPVPRSPAPLPPRRRLLSKHPYRTLEAYLDARGPSPLAEKNAPSPAEVLAAVEESGLRGRGGAGFPTGRKWRTLAEGPGSSRHVVCNAAEGEPGTFKDRWLIRSNPYAVLEGMLLAARAIGAGELFVGIKGSFRPEIERLRAAIAEMTAAGLLGDRSIHLALGPDEYLFGEEKALLRFIEQGDALPREAHEPPFERGLFDSDRDPRPALVNNAETFAHAAVAVREGPEAFRALGTDDTPGTVLFTVSGDVRRPGVFELPAGISVRELIEVVAGGPRPGRAVKLVLAGVSNAALHPSQLDTPADFGSLAAVGSGLGSAGFVVYDDRRSAARVAQAVGRFLYRASCNQCSPCKFGLGVASRELDRMHARPAAEAVPASASLTTVRTGARIAPQANRCYLPVQGSIVIPSLLERFREDYEEIARLAPAELPPPVPVPLLADWDPARAEFLVVDPTLERSTPGAGRSRVA